MAVSDLELGGRRGFVYLAPRAFLLSEFFSFITLNGGGEGGGGRGRLPGPLTGIAYH